VRPDNYVYGIAQGDEHLDVLLAEAAAALGYARFQQTLTKQETT
jgi:hypothetical protein